MTAKGEFQGVLCCCLDTDRSVQETIIKLLDLKTTSEHFSISCFDLKLKNKYYQANIHLIESANLFSPQNELCEDRTTILNECQAIILYGNGQTITTEQLDKKHEQFSDVSGEPRILLYDGIDEQCPAQGAILDWCIKNGYDFIDATDEDASKQLTDSLSAYKWSLRSENDDDKPKLNDELMKKLVDFDSLLGKLSAYKERPELRGDPEDKNIMEIADLLSGLLGDDVDDFLENEGATSSTGEPIPASTSIAETKE